ncbi:MAG: ribosome silencing factor, partial [Kiritimatiellaeota bacterium]|nr:ribosome silencing factor [Kiritimatiellota bacterium]
KALLSHVQERMREAGVKSHRKTGQPESGWVILDFIHVVVHLFTPEARAYYNIEKLWQGGKDLA